MSRLSTTTPVGALTLRPVDPLTDAVLLHGWLTHPKSAFWMIDRKSVV